MLRGRAGFLTVGLSIAAGTLGASLASDSTSYQASEFSGRVLAATAAVPWYTGPLFSVHEHFGSRDFGRSVAKDADFFASVMDGAGVSRVMAFVPTRLSNRPGVGEQQIGVAAQVYPDRFVPFWHMVSEEFLRTPEGLRQVFAEGPFWAGSGEWALWQQYRFRPDQQYTAPDDAILLQVYDVVAEFDRTVMVHPHYGRAALERALSYNRRTPFLIHGTQAATRRPPCLPMQAFKCMDVSALTELMRVHPNFFFDVSATANPHTLEETVDGIGVKAHFRRDMDDHVEEAYEFYWAAFEAFPERFLWGIDTGNLASNYDPEFFSLQIEFYRKLLGRLTPATAEKIAFRNAERILLRKPTLEGPSPGVALTSLGATLSWINPPNTVQYQLQVAPLNNDGPGINIIRNPETSSTVQSPDLGQGSYVMLPGMSYMWRIRTTAANYAVDENSPAWRPWSEPRTFRTPAPSSGGITPLQPATGSTVAAGSVTVQWANTASDIFYYEVQASGDPTFNTDPATATSFVWHNLVHGGATTPLNSWTTPELPSDSTVYWRVRPRVQGDGTPVDWSTTWSFQTAGAVLTTSVSTME